MRFIPLPDQLSPHLIMHIRIAIALVAGVLAGCATRTADAPAPSPGNASPGVQQAEVIPEATSSAATLDAYKLDLAQRISQKNAARIYSGRPQALLRSVVVVRYAVDAHGRLLHSEIMRSNRDREAEATALAALRSAAPFPKPAAHLMKKGRLEISETWLFNRDGRFQLRTVALPQMDR